MQECGEHLVRIRVLEQEVERHLRRVRCLEAQRAEVAEEERRVEREREHARHATSLHQLEFSLNSRRSVNIALSSALAHSVALGGGGGTRWHSVADW